MTTESIILTDTRYTNFPQEFASYDAMIEEIETMCAANGWEFDATDDLVYEEK